MAPDAPTVTRLLKRKEAVEPAIPDSKYMTLKVTYLQDICYFHRPGRLTI